MAGGLFPLEKDISFDAAHSLAWCLRE
ncbi:uncharacterized protein METZ01_LOCUS329140 [marine metagenome]|uniref:Uncharacterized protein n=1 Tax=marine metagenome TaxID=408172 RepID=A0A382PSS9_9ZZZZ